MGSDQELMKAVRDILARRGADAIERARKEILKCEDRGGSICEALEYFASVTLADGLPVFPALVSLSREAIDGKTEKTSAVGAALTLIAGTAEVHDDIIDQSIVKYSKKTVFGKFGSAVALLAGDALLFQGLTLLQKECEDLVKDQRKAILSLVHNAIFEIGNAEALETRLMRKSSAKGESLLDVIKLKAVVPEVHCRIGGILGNASEDLLDSLGRYGRNFGVASLVRDEFLDMWDYSELRNRLKNECPPLPMLYAFENSDVRNSIEKMLNGHELGKENYRVTSKIVLESDEAKTLANYIKSTINEKLSPDPFEKAPLLRTEATLLLKAAVSGL